MKRNHGPTNKAIARRRLGRAIATISTVPLVCAIAHIARADDIYNNPAGGLWSTAANWTTNPPGSHIVPPTGDRAFLNGLGNYTVTLDTDYSSFHTLLFLVLDAGNGVNNSTTLAQTNPLANMAASTEWIGDGGSATATYLQTTANNVDFGDLDVGHTLTTTVGQYKLQGGNLTVLGNEYLGFNGSGTLNQTGGAHTVGTATTNENLFLGFNALSSGSATLNGATAQLTVNGSAYVGGSNTVSRGFGTLIVQNGNMTVAGTLKVWNGTGNVSLTGGTLSVGSIDTSGTPSTFHWTGGNLSIGSAFLVDSSGPLGSSINIDSSKSLLVQGEEDVGETSPTTITQTGGTHTITNVLLLGFSNDNMISTYSLSGNANLSASGEEIARHGIGLFTQTGGTNTDFGDFDVSTNNGNGTYALSGGTLAVSGNANIGGQAGGPGDVGILAIQSGTATVSGSLKVWDNGPSISQSHVDLSGGELRIGSLDLTSNPAGFNWTGGTLTLTNTNIIFDSTLPVAITSPFSSNFTLLTGQTLNISQSETIANGGTASLTLNNGSSHSVAGTLTLNTGGTLTLLPGNSFSYGLFIHNGGVINGPFTNSSNFIQFGGSFTGTFTNDGAISLNGSSINGATSVSNNADGTIIGPGLINAPFANAGTLNVPSGATKAGSFVNTGIIELSSPSAQLGPVGIITNNAIIEGFGKISDDIINNGTIQPIGGTLNISGALTNLSGLLAAAAGTNLLISSGLTVNSGIISLTGGTFDNNNHPLSNFGQIVGYGTLRTGGLTNNNIMTLTGGTSTINGNVTNAAGKTILAKNFPAIFTGIVTNNGTIKTTSTTITFTGNYTGNAYISDPSTNIFQANATTIPGGSMTGGPGDGFIFNTFTNNGTFQNGGTLSVSSSITNTAAFSQSGPQSWSPGATFTNTSGTTTFASNAKLYGLSITAGTVDIATSKFIIEPANKFATLAALQANIANHSLIASNMPPNFALALLDNALLNKTTFGGNPADPDSLLLSEELLGDANADGHVDLSDLSTLLNSFGSTTPNWTAGNFDHAPTIDLTDLSDVLNNFGASNPKISSSQ